VGKPVRRGQLVSGVRGFYYEAFAGVPGMGNPAGVVLDGDLPAAVMQRVARNIGFNESAFVTAGCVGRMRELGLTRFRVDLLRETPEQAMQLFDLYSAVVSGADDGRHVWRQLRALNQLGVTRGTLQVL